MSEKITMLDLLKRKLIAVRYADILLASLLSFIVRILGALSGFVATFFIARSLGASESGYYFLAFSIISILASVSRIGLSNVIVRFVAADLEQSADVMRKALALAGVVSIVISGLVYICSDFFAIDVFNKPDVASLLKAMSVGVIGLTLLTLSANALQGLREVVASIFILNICVNLLLILAILWGVAQSATDLARIYSAAVCLTAVLGITLFWWFKPKSCSSAVPWKIIWASCLPLWAVMIMSQMVQWSGQFIAGAYVSSQLVAQLAVAQRTAMLASFVLVAVNLVVAPRFAALHRQGDIVGLESLAILSVKLVGVLALPIIGVMLIFPNWLMGLFGEGFAGGSQLLQILAVGQFINAITGSVGYLLMMSGHERDMRNVTLISGSVALILTWLLTIVFGATGNAIGTAVAVASQNLLAVYFVKKRLGFNTLAVWR